MNNDPYMKATVYFCSECMGPASMEQWNSAWWTEFIRRTNDPDFDVEDHGKDCGLDDRMVCPRCRFVHQDDDCSYVSEYTGDIINVKLDEVDSRNE